MECNIVHIFKNIQQFIFRLRFYIKIMSESEFGKLLDNCDEEQLIYALYFRYC